MGSDELITDAEMHDAPEWAWRLANDIVMKRQGCGNSAVLIHRALTAQLAEARESERAAVVAWLRGVAVKYDMSGGHDEAVTLEIAADAFEAGEHLT